MTSTDIWNYQGDLEDKASNARRLWDCLSGGAGTIRERCTYTRIIDSHLHPTQSRIAFNLTNGGLPPRLLLQRPARHMGIRLWFSGFAGNIYHDEVPPPNLTSTQSLMAAYTPSSFIDISYQNYG